MCYYRLTLGTLGHQGTWLADEKGAKMVHKKNVSTIRVNLLHLSLVFPKNIETGLLVEIALIKSSVHAQSFSAVNLIWDFETADKCFQDSIKF